MTSNEPPDDTLIRSMQLHAWIRDVIWGLHEQVQRWEPRPCPTRDEYE